MPKTRMKPIDDSGPLPSKAASPSQTEQALLDATQRLQSILIANEVATWTWDIVNDRLAADQNMARLFGVGPEDAAGGPLEHYFQAIHPEDRPRVAAALAAVLAGPDDKYAIDYRIVRKDGSMS